MNNDKTATTEPTTLTESELDSTQGGARINLDAFISVLNTDTLRHQLGMTRPKGIDVGVGNASLSSTFANLSRVGVVRG